MPRLVSACGLDRFIQSRANKRDKTLDDELAITIMSRPHSAICLLSQCWLAAGLPIVVLGMTAIEPRLQPLNLAATTS